MILSELQKVQFDAFKAGFDNSCEGWNGEYTTNTTTREMLEQDLLDLFLVWVGREVA